MENGRPIFSSEFLFQTFPRVRKSDSWDDQCSEDYNGFPKFTPPKSKYSSTETELSSDEEDYKKFRYRRDSTGIMTLSGLSTSTSSSGIARKRRRRRKRKEEKQSLSNGSEREPGSLYLSIRSQDSCKSNLSQSSSLKSRSESSWGSIRSRRKSQFAPLHSVNDLKHATGRHRGISGSFTPAIDSVIFAMFYTSDLFDNLFFDDETSHHIMEPDKNIQMKRNILGILRKEIVYSLRNSYFCPAEKIVKLVRILEESFPLERFQDPSNFVDLIFSKVVNQHRHHSSAFINYSNGSSNYIFKLSLKERLWVTRNSSNFKGTILTIQNLLEVYVNRGSNDLVGNSKLSTVPYPAFIIQVMRGSTGTSTTTLTSKVYCDDDNDDDDTHLNGSTCRCDNQHHQNYPVIPNMEIDLTTLISQNGPNHHNVGKEKCRSSSFMGLSSAKQVGDETGHVGVRESRVVSSLKTVWKRMYRYLEDFASSPSTHFPSAENSFMDNYNESGGLRRTSLPSLMQSSFLSRRDDNHHYFQLSRSPSPSSSSSLSFTSSSPHPRQHEIPEKPPYIFPPISSSKKRGRVVPQVKMELIAVICKSGGNVCSLCNDGLHGTNKCGNTSTTVGNAKMFSGYSVYCKAKSKKDKIESEYAPWVLYQSRCGVAPQVTLIENFGKWISSLERNREDLSLYHVPMEIRRVLEDSEMLIYQRIENTL